MIITGLKINGMPHPMGYAFSNVTVSWRVEESASLRQRESRVRIALDEKMEQFVSERRGVLPCAGTELAVSLRPRTTYFVRVSVTGEDGDSAQSEVASFDTGKMDEPWQAKWIGPSLPCDFHPILTGRFQAASGIARARLYVTGLGLYEARLNGQKVGDDFLAPFYNDYNCAVQVQTYDVTAQLAAENELSILLGNGWYKGNLGYNGQREVYGSRFAALAELHIEYADGTAQVFGTDERWAVSPSDVTYSDIYDGEGWDRTLYAEGRPVYPAELLDMGGVKLVDRWSMPLHVMEELPVKEVIHTPKGETVLDFGQNFAGYVAFHVRGFAPGTTITLEHGEVLQGGNFYHDNYRAAKTLITYVSDGREEIFEPHFTYMGFRYVKVSGWPGELDPKDFTGKAVYSAMERTGFLESGHKKVNRLFANALWGLKSNFLDMPTDCPQRNERLGWTGDAQVFAPTASFFMDTRAFYRKYLWDMRNDQLLHDGAVASYLPNFDNGMTAAAVWADAATFIPDTVYETTGDLALLREHYPLMRDWVDCITRRDGARPGGAQHLYNFAFTFGDWLAMDGVTEQSMKGGTEDAYVASVYYYASTVKTARAARTLGLGEDAERFEKLAAAIREALLHEYFTPAGRLSVDTQAAYVIALRFGLWRDRERLCAGLRDRLRRDGFRIRCGFVGAPLICETLAENGMQDIAMHLFLQEKFPSWLHCVNLGATTIWERWNSLLDDGSISGTGMNSLNHYAYGSIVSFAVRHIAGFTPLEPGYRRVRIAPMPDARLGRLSLRYRSVSGDYASSWSIEKDGSLRFHVEVPFDCEAVLILPESEERRLAAGSHDFLVKPQRDYRRLYTERSLLDDLSGDERAMTALQLILPAAYDMARSGDIENLSLSFVDLKTMPWFGCRAEDVDAAVEALSVLRADNEEETP